jgi:ribosomal protein L39E
MTKHYQKKVKLSVHEKRTKWAPFWIVLKKFGKGRRVHPSSITKQRRHWRRTKLKQTPRKQSKSLG